MKRLVLAAVAMVFLALQSMFVTATVATVATVITTEMAWADCVPDVSCKQPTGVGDGEVPIHHVVDCVIGPEGGPYTRIACNDPRAVHISPRGGKVVCFLGSDNKYHWDLVGWVYKGRKFYNHKVNGRWQPHWVDGKGGPSNEMLTS